MSDWPEDATIQRFSDATSSSGVMVFAEMVDGELLNVGRELMGPGREMADQLGVSLTAMVIHHDVGSAPQDLISLGADKVVVWISGCLYHACSR